MKKSEMAEVIVRIVADFQNNYIGNGWSAEDALCMAVSEARLGEKEYKYIVKCYHEGK